MPVEKGPPLNPLEGTAGYGQLSISISGVIALPGTKHAAGVWALVGAPDEVKKLEVAGPTQTAAVVAHGGVGAVYAESTLGPAASVNSVSGSGLHAQSQSGRAVDCWSQTNYGVSGDSQSFAGVRGTSVSATGTEGWSTTGAGVQESAGW